LPGQWSRRAGYPELVILKLQILHRID